MSESKDPVAVLQSEDGQTNNQTLVKTRNTDFSPGEMQVLQMISNGYTNIEIANALHISARTVESRRASMMRKSDTTNSATLIMYAVRNNILS